MNCDKKVAMIDNIDYVAEGLNEKIAESIESCT